MSNLSAGSGNYLEVDALSLGSDSIRLLARVQTDTRHDPLVALRAAYRRKR
ncbi:PliI family lysozyme inhibitor of I-type lysozyme [Burkholderia vietnamiensis]|uniref:PliI family lysozyme inhibitor of I-type lysozyme n=1 Tax=Burkholderia vietnamiensis TaxID=60552 RepID=UPI00402ADB9E